MTTTDLRIGVAAAVAIVLATLLAYRGSLAVPFIFDDPAAIVNNPSIRHWESALAPPADGTTTTGRPILNLSFAANYAWGGLSRRGFHAVNLAIHALAGLTLFGVARQTLERAAFLRPTRALAADAGLVAALLWTLHPLQTESVTYVAQRAESLMGLFYLLTLYCFVRGATASRPNRWWFVSSVAACALGMGTKEVMVSAPLLVALYDRTFLSGSLREGWRRHRIWYLSLAATWIPLACLVIQAKGRAGTAGFSVGMSWWRYALEQFPAVARYLTLSIWPGGLAFDYGARWSSSVQAAPALAIVAALAAASVWAFLRPPASGAARALGFAGIWFFAILAPTSVVPGLRQTMAEHRMYLALVPLCVVAAAVGFNASGCGRWSARSMAAAGCMATAALGLLTAARNRVYRSELSLWSDTVAKVPDNPFARNNFGLALFDAIRVQEAIEQYRAALALRSDLPPAHNNLGVALAAVGDFAAATAEYRQALHLDPRYAEAENNLGFALARLDRPSEAAGHYEAALRLRPKYAAPRNGLGMLLLRAGRDSDTAAQFQEALRLDPGFAEAENGLGAALASAGRPLEAAEHFRRAIALKPAFADAHNNLGGVYAKLGRADQARAEFERALTAEPENPRVLANLARELAGEGRTADAVASYERALRLDSHDAAAQTGLAIALLRLNRDGEALPHFFLAVELAPDRAFFRLNLGNALAQAGRKREAEAQYEAALRIEPGLAPAREQLARLRRGASATPR